MSRIFQVAEKYAAADGASDLGLSWLLRAYDDVLRSHGVNPADDTFFYRFILKLRRA